MDIIEEIECSDDESNTLNAIPNKFTGLTDIQKYMYFVDKYSDKSTNTDTLNNLNHYIETKNNINENDKDNPQYSIENGLRKIINAIDERIQSKTKTSDQDEYNKYTPHDYYKGEEQKYQQKKHLSNAFGIINELYTTEESLPEKINLLRTLDDVYNDIEKYWKEYNLELYFNEEFVIYTYLVVCDLGRIFMCEEKTGQISLSNTDTPMSVIPKTKFSERYDNLLKSWKEMFLSCLNVFITRSSEKEKTAKDMDHLSTGIGKLLKSIDLQISHSFKKTKNVISDKLYCQVTNKVIKKDEEFYVYQFAYMHQKEINGKKKLFIQSERYAIALHEKQDSLYLFLVLSIVYFFNYKTFILQKISDWKKSQKFGVYENAHLKYEQFKLEHELKYQLVLHQTLLYNNIIKLINHFEKYKD